MKRKGELSTEMIVMLLLVVILLLIFIIILWNKYDFFKRNTDCYAQGGTCMAACQEGSYRLYSATCPPIGQEPNVRVQVCCMRGVD